MTNPDPSNPSPSGITRPPIGKPKLKLKLTPKGGKKQGTRPSMKLGGNKPLPVTQPPFRKPQALPSVDTPVVPSEHPQPVSPSEDLPPAPPSLSPASEGLPPPPPIGESTEENVNVPEEESLAEDLPPAPPSLSPASEGLSEAKIAEIPKHDDKPIAQDSSTLDSRISEDDYKEIKKGLSSFSDRLSDFDQKLEKSEKNIEDKISSFSDKIEKLQSEIKDLNASQGEVGIPEEIDNKIKLLLADKLNNEKAIDSLSKQLSYLEKKIVDSSHSYERALEEFQRIYNQELEKNKERLKVDSFLENLYKIVDSQLDIKISSTNDLINTLLPYSSSLFKQKLTSNTVGRRKTISMTKETYKEIKDLLSASNPNKADIARKTGVSVVQVRKVAVGGYDKKFDN